mmetsp:Transcript_41912/g.100671  ORF Transcript_41912/g.100671 Transcript_41912/m.100671 type:complete len:220 (+) Transcript_41912:651-1310(+)
MRIFAGLTSRCANPTRFIDSRQERVSCITRAASFSSRTPFDEIKSNKSIQGNPSKSSSSITRLLELSKIPVILTKDEIFPHDAVIVDCTATSRTSVSRRSSFFTTMRQNSFLSIIFNAQFRGVELLPAMRSVVSSSPYGSSSLQTLFVLRVAGYMDAYRPFPIEFFFSIFHRSSICNLAALFRQLTQWLRSSTRCSLFGDGLCMRIINTRWSPFAHGLA